MNEGSLFVLGNLLLDMVATVEESYLKEYELEPDSIQTAEMKHLKIFEDLLKLQSVKISPGGSALNTVRLAQKIIGSKNAITLVGAVGNDEAGELLINTVKEEGINMLAQVVSNSTTGKCASLLTNGGITRTMVTDLGASLKFSHEVFMSNNEALKWLEKAKLLYISGYFLKVSPDTVMEVVNRAALRRIPIFLNLNAVWVTTVCKNELLKVLPFTSLIFGNASEAVSFAEQLGLPSEYIENVADALSLFQTDETIALQRTVVITRGEQPVICVDSSGGTREYLVPVVPKESLVDSTGAGDAFVGGFIAQHLKGGCIDECISHGILAATEELKGYGFIIPEYL